MGDFLARFCERLGVKFPLSTRLLTIVSNLKNTMNQGICNLCKLEKKLIKKSHIIPDFVYRNSGMFDDKHRLKSFTKEDLLSGKKPKSEQTGVYDGGILCANCDNVVIGKYEKYASDIIYGKNLSEANKIKCTDYNDGDVLYSNCKNIDYKNYRLFLLSILFRASISKNSFFENVGISEANLEYLRKMIFTGNSGNYNDFPFTVTSLTQLEKVSEDLIVNPSKLEVDGLIRYNFIFGGMLYTFFEGKNLDTYKFESLLIRPENNELTILHLFGLEGQKYFKNLIGAE